MRNRFRPSYGVPREVQGLQGNPPQFDQPMQPKAGAGPQLAPVVNYNNNQINSRAQAAGGTAYHQALRSALPTGPQPLGPANPFAPKPQIEQSAYIPKMTPQISGLTPLGLPTGNVSVGMAPKMSTMRVVTPDGKVHEKQVQQYERTEAGKQAELASAGAAADTRFAMSPKGQEQANVNRIDQFNQQQAQYGQSWLDTEKAKQGKLGAETNKIQGEADTENALRGQRQSELTEKVRGLGLDNDKLQKVLGFIDDYHKADMAEKSASTGLKKAETDKAAAETKNIPEKLAADQENQKANRESREKIAMQQQQERNRQKVATYRVTSRDSEGRPVDTTRTERYEYPNMTPTAPSGSPGPTETPKTMIPMEAAGAVSQVQKFGKTLDRFKQLATPHGGTVNQNGEMMLNGSKYRRDEQRGGWVKIA